MMTCPRCRGLLRLDDDGLLVCRACGRVANPPPLMLVDKWPGGVQPPPQKPKPRSGNHEAKPPRPTRWDAENRGAWTSRRVVVEKPDGKTFVAPTRVSTRGGLLGET